MFKKDGSIAHLVNQTKHLDSLRTKIKILCLLTEKTILPPIVTPIAFKEICFRPQIQLQLINGETLQVHPNNC